VNNLGVGQESLDDFDRYLSIPNAFRATTVLDVIEADGGCELVERVRGDAFRKDYDKVEDPRRWPGLFDMSKWIFLAAYADGRRLGGAIVALDTPGVDMLEGRSDLAVLWDIRVDEPFRGRGVGSALIAQVEARAFAAGCRELKVETQNTNPGACNFYRRRGFSLSEVHAQAYASLPAEIQLIWRVLLPRAV
jgi:ribosomal protein S18 acetylase RimI-like enzyme